MPLKTNLIFSQTNYISTPRSNRKPVSKQIRQKNLKKRRKENPRERKIMEKVNAIRCC